VNQRRANELQLQNTWLTSQRVKRKIDAHLSPKHYI